MNFSLLTENKKLEEVFKRTVTEYSFRKLVESKTTTFDSLEKFLNSQDEFDIIFVDDDFCGSACIETAKIIRARIPDSTIVVMSDDIESVYEAFVVKAYRFFLKPVGPAVISEAIESYHNESFTFKHIIIKEGNTFHSLGTDEIIYLEANGKEIIVYTLKKSITTTTPYLQILEQLPSECFFSVHRSFTVNMMYVTAFAQTCISLSNGNSVPISRRRKVEFYLKFSEFARGHMFYRVLE